MKRIWHPYTKWEDYRDGMWRVSSKTEREDLLPKARAFTGDPDLYGGWMLKVLTEYPIACEQNLSDTHQNRRAWIGHAACCLGIGCPEDVTREAWGSLNEDQQTKANAKADEAIQRWENEYESQNPSLHRKMGKTGLP